MRTIEIRQSEISGVRKEGGIVEVDISVAVKTPIDAKALVLCVRGKQLDEILKANPHWILSPKLKAAYRYFPKTNGPSMNHIGVVALPANSVFSIEPWLLSKHTDLASLIGGVFSRTSISGLEALERIV